MFALLPNGYRIRCSLWYVAIYTVATNVVCVHCLVLSCIRPCLRARKSFFVLAPLVDLHLSKSWLVLCWQVLACLGNRCLVQSWCCLVLVVSCRALSRPFSYRLVFSCPVLPLSFLSDIAWSCRAWSCLVVSCMTCLVWFFSCVVLSVHNWSNPVWSCLVHVLSMSSCVVLTRRVLGVLAVPGLVFSGVVWYSVWPCLVLCSLVFSCVVLSCPVLTCLFMSWFARSCHVLSCLVLSCCGLF